MAIHPGDHVGYLYAADLYCASCLIDRLVREGRVNPSGPLVDRDRVELLLDRLARVEKIDRARECSFDSGDFPKALLLEDVHALSDEEEQGATERDIIADRCCGCGELLEDELPIRPSRPSEPKPTAGAPAMDPGNGPGVSTSLATSPTT